MKNLVLLFAVLLTLACSHAPAATAASAKPKVAENSPWKKVVGKTGWEFEIDKNWETYSPAESTVEAMWRSPDKDGMIAMDSALFSGETSELFVRIADNYEDAGLTILKASQMKIDGKQGAGYVMTAGGLILVKFVVVGQSRAYSLSCAADTDKISKLKDTCKHALETLHVK